ncbi:zinc metalloproteinase [Grosmannia clavigera kw1407]|uniref:Zinc metalloproteinase n=1 Tax=Grosmannia clavigera (strain kw1407 / UAMH 11150) TaxID=655863 RepID=F0XR79_GROCL|nr:zinc metalloproteinase [Grosmannia clavigera kw1407]EFW99993.1 zinc metalloproteinase [Grosmannia clavigera kw1407]
MAPSFLNIKQLRRKSRASFRTEKSNDTSSEGSHSNGTAPTSGSLTPPSIAQQSDPALHLQTRGRSSPPPPVPRRPPLTSSGTSTSMSTAAGGNFSTKRYSVSGMAGLGAPLVNGSNSRLLSLPISPYSPRIDSIQDNSWVYQKVLLVHGMVGDPAAKTPVDGTVTVSRLDDGFPAVQWPVYSGHFKALVYLLPGPNKIRFDFASPKLANSGTSNPIHASYFTLHMMPPMGAPPVHLAILLAKDSPGTFDAMPTRAEREGNGLETAVRKFRMAAYLWQAFTAEQMWRNRLGRRVFRYEEEWTQGSANYRDRETGQMRSEARIHVVRSNKTVAELRDLNRAQQNDKGTERGALFDIAAEAMREHFQPKAGQTLYVSVLLLDAHWDTTAKTITGHAALGGSAGDVRLAVFGSHCLQSYPSSFEEVVPAFLDCTPTDTAFVANDCNEAGSSWEAANIGIGGHLHETGHLLGLPHRENGVMLRDYVRLNRSFVTHEAYSTRTRTKGGGLMLEADECTWHRLDCLHFRSHPCFRLPSDLPAGVDESVHAWPVDGGNVLLTAPSGVAYVEVYAEGDDVCHTWIEYPTGEYGSGSPGTSSSNIAGGGGGGSSSSLSRQVTLADQDVRSRLPEAKRRKDGPLRVVVHSWAGGSLNVADLRQLTRGAATKLSSGSSSVMSLKGRTAFRSSALGLSQTEGSTPQELVFSSAERQERVMTRIIVYHGLYVDGMEFVYDDDSRQLFGKRGGKPGGDMFEMDVRRGEYISGFSVRSGFWVDGIQILTSLGRRSPVYGNAQGGSANTLIPPRGYTICGVAGSSGTWVDGFSVLITK